MKVILFGTTGMVGQGVLQECLADPQVETVLSVTRARTGVTHPKLRELIPANFYDLAPHAAELGGYDAAFFCLGVSSLGMKESDYRRITYDLTLAAARILAERNPAMTFIYVSGTGTDSTARGRIMWARVKGETENAILALPFRATYMFRPGIIQPKNGVRSKTAWVRGAYVVLAPLASIIKRVAPNAITTTEKVGRAMIAVAQRGYSKPVLENADINATG
jgi:uncharacterized protein YbjT (DUF2867 family)